MDQTISEIVKEVAHFLKVGNCKHADQMEMLSELLNSHGVETLEGLDRQLCPFARIFGGVLDAPSAREDDLCNVILEAINILDGNADRIDWTDKKNPELLRKLCEHLEATDEPVDNDDHQTVYVFDCPRCEILSESLKPLDHCLACVEGSS